MTRTFNNPEELMIALINGEEWIVQGIIGKCVFDKTKAPHITPFRYKIDETDETDFTISEGLYSRCDGETLWHKVEEKTELDILKEKYASGDYIAVSPDSDNLWYRNSNPDWSGSYKLIHKRHKDILDAYLSDDNVEILAKETGIKELQIVTNFIESYNEDFDYRLKPKKKTISLAMFTCQNINNISWEEPKIYESISAFRGDYDKRYFSNHHEIPNTRYTQEINDD